MKRPRVVPAWRVRMAQRRLDGMLRAAVARCLERERAREPVFVYVDETRDWNELEARVLASYDRGVCLTVRGEGNLAERLDALYGARGEVLSMLHYETQIGGEGTSCCACGNAWPCGDIGKSPKL